MANFDSYFQAVENAISGATKGFMAKLDHVTFTMTINGLKGNDYQAVSIIIDQLVKEHRSVSIPPLYVVAKAHPNLRIREKAQSALEQLDAAQQIESLTKDLAMKEAVATLVKHYGNYKAKP